MAHYRNLIVWQKGMELVVSMYRYTRTFPSNEQYGLISQMRRAAVSIPSNIAEGSRRRGKDTAHFLNIAFGSASELDTQLEASRHLGFGIAAEREVCEGLLSEILRMLNKMTLSK
ncbi:MAG: four helix bundle protein [Patescibacteria group bacterium]